MTRIPSVATYANPFLQWMNVVLSIGQMMWASSHVITHRTSRMLLAHPNYGVRDRRELALMRQEKVDAANESANAMGAQMVRMSLELGLLAFKQWLAAATALTALASSRAPARSFGQAAKFLGDTATRSAVAVSQLSSSSAKLAHHGLKPLHSRATKNAKRLKKR
jgi:hypothetical protein